MLTIPKKYTESIQRVIEWHLNAYVPDTMFNIPTNRILERMKRGDIVQLEDRELYYINECIADAKNNVPECGIEQPVIDEIYDWIFPEYKKTKQSQR